MRPVADFTLAALACAAALALAPPPPANAQAPQAGAQLVSGDQAGDAQADAAPDKPGTADGMTLMERGAEQFLDGLAQQMAPALEGLQDRFAEIGPQLRTFLQEMGPALARLLDKVDDITLYHPPEMLPNGDIILRRKQSAPEMPAPPASEPEIGPGGEVEI